MLVNILLLLGGFVALIFGANALVDAASSLAARWGVPSIVIGLTIVAFGTSAPELVVNVFAATSGSTDMVLGNVLGSNIFNVLGILGISALIYPLTVKSNTTWIEIPLSLLAAICVFVVASDVVLDGATTNLISRSEGIVLLLFFLIFLVYNLVVAKSGGADEEMETKEYSVGKGILFIILGLAGLILGGRLIVTSAVSIAEVIGLSERVIGLTVVSIGTSLPELATSIIAVRKKNVDIAIGNVVGSNIFNIFLILGVSGTIVPLTINPDSFFDILVNIVAGLLLFIFVFTGRGRKVERWEGAVFVIAYIAYVTYLIM
ncbi:cation:H+ antiporter [Salinimicrobium sediminis]|uniref:Cation:H+ antiporter n=1 Tax=Salinimicrobium sediminis TaxID=1343891 RepID=A0A285XAA6_9FLAO|nr:calcium/sodium antiporter [Salinimicrobium sediminis]MDX1754239.1 calcium/sodium antiporter [Salinimicrobium sediminis]SOC81369.1 cation:H+ antiporter [Salinimicrobium sediminis]